METIQMNAKAKSDGIGSREVVSNSHPLPGVSGSHQVVSQSPNGHHASDKSPKHKEESDKSLDDLESTLEGYFSYIGAKISDVATAGTAPKDEVDSGGKNTCQVCGQHNGSWFEMRKHMRTHSDFRPYKCNMCPRTFHDMYKLKRHLVVHTGLKPYQCHICDQRLSRAEHLRRHLLIHKEVKPFKCNLCDFSARRIDSVRSHQRSKHQGEWVQVVTVRSIVDIVSDETTANTNLTPPLHGKKKKKKKKKIFAGASGVGEEGDGAGGEASGSSGIAAAMGVNTTNSACQNPTPGLPTTQQQPGLSGDGKNNDNANSRPIPGIASLRMPGNFYGIPGAPQGFPYVPQHHQQQSQQQQQQQQQPQQQPQQQQQQQQQSGVSPVSSSSSSKMSDSSPSPNKVKNESSTTTKYMGVGGTSSGSHPTSAAATPSGSGLMSPPPVSMPGQPGLCPSLHPVMTMGMDPASQAAFNLQAAGGMNYYPGLPGQYGLAPGGQSFSPYFTMKPVFPEAMPVNHHHHPHHPPPHHHAAHLHPAHRAVGSSGTTPSTSSANKSENSSHSSPVNMSYSAKMGSSNS